MHRAGAGECDSCAGVSGAIVLVRAGCRRTTIPSARLPACALALALAGWWWGSVRLDALDASVLGPEIGRSAAVTAVVTGPVRRSTFALRLPAEVRRFDERRLRERVLLELPLGRSPPQGAVLELRATVAAPRGPEDGFDERGWLARRGVHVVLHGRDWRMVGRRGGIGGLSDRLRAHVARAIAPALEGERHAVLAGIVLGEDEGLTDDLRDDFKASGLYHLLAVSGQNITFLALGVLGLAWLLGIPRLAAEAVAIAAIAGYVLAVGWQPSVVRAGVAGGLASLAWLLSRPRDRWHFLALGAAVLLAWTPASLLEPGFQLSFAAVGSIFLLLPRLRPALEGYPLPNWLREAIAVSTACGAATAPILWLQFGSVPVYSLPANALVTPAIGPLLGIALVGCLLEPVLPTAALALGWLNGWLAAYIAACARVIGGLPFAQVGSTTAVCLLLGTPVALLALHRLPRWRRPLAITCAAAAMPALLAWQFLPGARLPPPTGLRITFLDVGQGDSILLQVPEGAVLVDQGPPEADVARQLRGLGVRHLAAIVLTHPERDHVGGAEDVLRRLDGRPSSRSAARRLRPVRARCTRRRRRIGACPSSRRARATAFGSAASGSACSGRTAPEQQARTRTGSRSSCSRRYGEVDVLLTADAETDVTARLLSRRIEILKVAHHGSADPGLADELRELRPAVAVISCGRDNEYGHPTPSTLAALRDSPGLSLYRTDEDGRVVLESDGRRISVRSER